MLLRTILSPLDQIQASLVWRRGQLSRSARRGYACKHRSESATLIDPKVKPN